MTLKGSPSFRKRVRLHFFPLLFFFIWDVERRFVALCRGTIPLNVHYLRCTGLAQTSTPMGQRRFSALRRPAVEVEYNLGSPISSLPGPANSTVNYGPPIPISAALSGNANSDSTLDNSNHVARGFLFIYRKDTFIDPFFVTPCLFSMFVANLTFEKSQNSVEAQSNSPTSPADSPYSSQSLESDSGPSSAHDMIRRSMPNLNNVSRLRMPQPANLTAAGNLNRHHASDSGLRPPGATSSGIRPPVGRFANGPLTMRPQLAVPQTHVSTANPDAVRPSQPVNSYRFAAP